MKKIYIHPFVRILFLVFVVAGTIMNNLLYQLGLAYIVIIVPLILLAGLFKNHLKLLFLGMVPIFLSFVLLYQIILHYPWIFTGMKIAKLLIITTSFQIALSIPQEIMLATFKKWKIGSETKITLIGAYSVWADILSRTNLILTARFARGFIPTRNFVNTIRQVPYVFIPLVTGIMRTSTERATSWEEKDILSLIDRYESRESIFPFFFNLLIFIVSTIWLIIGVYNVIIS